MESLDLREIPEDVATRFGLDRLPDGRAGTSTAELLRLEGKRVVVTGGGGDGLGNAICHRVAEQGAEVVVVDIDSAAAAQTVAELRSRFGTPATALIADVTSSSEVDLAVSRVLNERGRIDVLINNAGGVGRTNASRVRPATTGAIADVTSDEIDAAVALNLTSALYWSRAAVSAMLADGQGGRIIYISSEFGLVGYSGAAVYSACKAGLIGLTRSLAREVGERGISPVCVAPGLLVGQRMLDGLARSTGSTGPFEFCRARASIGRPAVVDEVASVVAFLASPAGAYAHGTTVSVGGGMSG